MHKPKLNVIFRIIYCSPNQYIEKIILQLKTSWLATFFRLNARFFIRFCTTCTTYLSKQLSATFFFKETQDDFKMTAAKHWMDKTPKKLMQ